jgi:hypothetical protein
MQRPARLIGKQHRRVGKTTTHVIEASGTQVVSNETDKRCQTEPA